jgi:uncharacterized protein (DUF849 family)
MGEPTGETPTNVELVSRAAALAARSHRPLATVADARRLLGLS